VNFHIGDKVRVGMRVGTITDVGTMLIQVQTTEGGLRVVCPWELVRTREVIRHGSGGAGDCGAVVRMSASRKFPRTTSDKSGLSAGGDSGATR
jgi:small-conductance mechanosensitive channel